MIRRPPRSPLFPSPPLFRSGFERDPPALVADLPQFLEPRGAHAQRRREPPCDERVPRVLVVVRELEMQSDRKSTRLNSSHSQISYAVFCLKKKKTRAGGTLVMATTTTCSVSDERPTT